MTGRVGASLVVVLVLGACSSAPAATPVGDGMPSPTSAAPVPPASTEVIAPASLKGSQEWGFPVEILLPPGWSGTGWDEAPPEPDAIVLSPEGQRCELWLDGTAASGSADSAVTQNISWFVQQLELGGATGWTWTPVQIAGVPAALRFRAPGANMDVFAVGVPRHTGGIGLYRLQCTPPGNESILAGILASIAQSPT